MPTFTSLKVYLSW